MSDLTAAGRAKIKGKNFVFKKERRYPIHDESHARAALSMVAAHGTPAEQAKVRAAVHSKYPGIGQSKTAEVDGGYPFSDDTHTSDELWEKANEAARDREKRKWKWRSESKAKTAMMDAFFDELQKIAAHTPGRENADLRDGRSDGKPDTRYSAAALKKGVKVEYEHTKKTQVAKEIAKDHLEERPDYYEKLERMEKSPVTKTAMGAKMISMATRAGMKGMQAGGQQAAKASRVGFKLSNKGDAGQAGAKMIFGVRKTAEISQVEEAKKQHAVKSEGQLMKTLKPGDLIFSAPHRSKANGFMGRVFKPISRKIQGTDFGHTAMYVGDGKIVDTRIEREAKAESIKKLISKNNVVVVRPKGVTETERSQAVHYARRSIGKPYSKAALLRAATPFQGKFKGKGPEESNAVMCSGLAANAYAKRKFAPVSRKFIRPSQILGSKEVKPVAYLETAPQPV